MLYQTPESKLGKNRVLLDIEAADLEAVLARVVTIGGHLAQRVNTTNGDPIIICADPDGSEFCLELP